MTRQWLRYANPLVAIRSPDEALTAGRASAVALVLGAFYTGVGAVMTLVNGESMRQTAQDRLQAMDLPPQSIAVAEATSNAILTAGLILNPIMVVLQLVLAWVQWKRPNLAIPALCAMVLGFNLYGAIQMVGVIQSGMLAGLPAQSWAWMVASYAVYAVFLALHVTGARGAAKLRDFARR